MVVVRENRLMEEQLMRFLKVLCCAAALTAMTAPLATAQTTQWSKKTFLTFSGPVQIPGKTLAAGTYTFRWRTWRRIGTHPDSR